jgi:hypothetical protein
MAYLLRKIRKARWTQEVDWLLEEDLQADALGDLGTASNELSVYHVAENRDNLNQVIAALAVNTKESSNIDFALFDENLIAELGIKIKKSKGELADDQVNNWHSDVYEISASKLLVLAKSIKKKAAIDRKMPKEVLTVVADSLQNNLLDRTRVKWKTEDVEKVEEIIAKRKMH